MIFSALRSLVFVAAVVAPLLAREPTSQDYDVWNAILTQHSADRTIYVWHMVEPTFVFDRGQTKSALEFAPEARPVQKAWSTSAAELDMEKIRFAQQRAVQRFRVNPPIKLLDATMLAQAVGAIPNSSWLFSPKLIPGADSIYRLSWPAYREDGRAAFLICAVCTQWWGSVIEYEVNKGPIDGKWRAGRMARRDFTHWENGKLFDDGS